MTLAATNANPDVMSPEELVIALGICLDANQPACIWGSPGIGKSDIVHQIAASRNLPVKDVRASLLDPVDLRGLPHVNGDNRAHWATPDFLPQSGSGILLLDELNRAVTMVQNACFQLVLNRQLGEYTLPQGWHIVAACNRESDGGGVTRMSSALCNRFEHLEMTPNVDSWCKWAINSGKIEPALIAFIRFRPHLLHEFNRDARAFPSPRSWEFVSRMVSQKPARGIQQKLFAGAVGNGASVEFSAFLQLYQGLPSIDGILLNPQSANVPSDPAVLYAISTGLAVRATVQNIARVMTYLDRMPQEYAVCSVKDATAREPKLCHTAEFTKWATTHADVVF